MKKLLLIVFISIVAGKIAIAQCDKKLVWTASKAEFVDDSGHVEDTKDIGVTVHTSGKWILVIHDDDPTDSLWGPVKDIQCNWKESMKDRKMTIQADLSERNSQNMESSLVIEAKDSKTTMLLSVHRSDGTTRHIRLTIVGYKEEK
jgi:hypothetical protein